MLELADNEASKPNPALAPLAVLVGRWRTTGTHPLVPGVTFHGQTTFAWMAGGAFLVMQSEIDEPQIPSGIAIFGTDDSIAALTMLYFDERAVSRRYDARLEGNVLMWWRNDPAFSQRCEVTIAPDGRTMSSRGQYNRDGAGWETDLALTYTRVE